jgi:hypothetical protein
MFLPASRKKRCSPQAVATVEFGLRLSRFGPTATAGPNPRIESARAGECRTPAVPVLNISRKRRRASC